MALDETGSTGQGKGGVKHVTEWRMYLSALAGVSRQSMDYELVFKHTGLKLNCEMAVNYNLNIWLFFFSKFDFDCFTYYSSQMKMYKYAAFAYFKYVLVCPSWPNCGHERLNFTCPLQVLKHTMWGSLCRRIITSFSVLCMQKLQESLVNTQEIFNDPNYQILQLIPPHKIKYHHQ